jgi:PEP-CTERM motif
MKTKILAATVLAAASASAIADGPGPLGTIDNMPVTLSNIVPMGIFQDVYSFTIANPGDMSGSVVAVNFGPYNILGLTVTLQDSTFAVVGSDNTPDAFTFSGLAAGNYALNVLGFASGTSGGFYAGGAIATTVPEPETYALMLAGLGIVCFVAFRRRAQR